jgi:hypothetical protein
MSDFFAELQALKDGGGPNATLLRQVRAVAGVRETGRHRFAVDPGGALHFESVDGAWRGVLDHGGRITRYGLATALDERKLIDALKRVGNRREDE